MANWKKVVVSGSSPEFFHVTSSGNISASGKLYGGLDENSSQPLVVVYNSVTGELEYKELNLVSTTAAPYLFIADIGGYTGETDGEETAFDFKLSYDTGNSGNGPQTPQTQITAFTSGNHQETTDSTVYTQNQTVFDVNLGNNTEFYNPGNSLTNNTPPTDVLHGLIPGSTKIDIPIRLQGFDNDAVPKYPDGFAFANYQAGAFNDGGIGELRIYVNNNTRNSPEATVDLAARPDKINGESTFGNSIEIYLSATSSNFQTDGTEDETKHHRSGSGRPYGTNEGDIIIPAALQNDGFNYAYVLHTGSKDGEDFGYITNFVQWFYDTNGASEAIGTNSNGLISFSGLDATETSSISGIKFYNANATTNASYQYGMSVTNQYNAVYSNSLTAIELQNITTNTTNNFKLTQSAVDEVASETYAGPSNASSFGKTLGSLNNAAAASASKTVITASCDDIIFPSNTFHQPSNFDATTATDASFDFLEDLSDNAEIGFNALFRSVDTSHKANRTITGNKLRGYLVNTLTVNADENYFEDFKGEEFRLQSKSYDGETDPSSSAQGYRWDGEKSIVNGGAGFNEGLIQYYTHLVYPGVFSGQDADRGNYDSNYGPTQPNDYGGASGTREYIRYFKVLAADQGTKSFNVEFVGSGSIVSEATSLTVGSADFKVYVRRTGGSVGGATSALDGDWVNQSDTSYGYTQTTGRIDITEDYTDINYSNQADFLPDGVIKVSDPAGSSLVTNEMIMIRISVPEDWGGYINAIGVKYGTRGSGGSAVLGQAGFTSL